MREVVVWYDGSCPLCRREIGLMRRLDRGQALTFVDVAEPGAAEACPPDPADMLSRFHVREDGQLLSGAAAFAAMWRAVPVLRPFGLMARNRHVLALLERLYGQFLKVRPRLQRLFRDQAVSH